VPAENSNDSGKMPENENSTTPPRSLRVVSFGGAYLVASIAMLMAIPPENWNTSLPRLDMFIDSWTNPPTWHDGDRWTTNFIGHPVMGALLYSFARHSDYSIPRSFLFATIASCFWEYCLESWFEHPSFPDLLITPSAGAFLGELRWYYRCRLLETRNPGRRTRLALAVLAPAYALWRRRSSRPKD
jgi:hypothetical protein